MSQSHIIAAFRRRLSLRGYTDIHIRFTGDGTYLVSALDPLAHFGVQVEMSELDMYFWR